MFLFFFFFSSRRRHTRFDCDWSSDVCSSDLLETIQTFRPKVAVVLNVTPDHLDRHRTFETYVDAKARIFENQHAEDRKSTRLNSSHSQISYAVFCLKKKKTISSVIERSPRTD